MWPGAALLGSTPTTCQTDSPPPGSSSSLVPVTATSPCTNSNSKEQQGADCLLTHAARTACLAPTQECLVQTLKCLVQTQECLVQTQECLVQTQVSSSSDYYSMARAQETQQQVATGSARVHCSCWFHLQECPMQKMLTQFPCSCCVTCKGNAALQPPVTLH